MEIASTTVHSLARYRSMNDEDAGTSEEPVAGPSNVTSATAAFKKELEDRTFDVDDEEFELEQGFQRGDDDESSDEPDDSEHAPSPSDDPKAIIQLDSLSPGREKSSSPDVPLYTDMFPEDIADAMIRELKEIGGRLSFFYTRHNAYTDVCS